MKKKINKDILVEKGQKNPNPYYIQQCEQLADKPNFIDWVKTGRINTLKTFLKRTPNAKVDKYAQQIVRYGGGYYIQFIQKKKGQTLLYKWVNDKGKVFIGTTLNDVEQQLWIEEMGSVVDWDEIRESWNEFLKNRMENEK